MTDEINYKTNPLHGLSSKNLLIELVDFYGFDILYAYLTINCFKTNPSIDSSIKFLKKTAWAREKVESFYMYQFKSLPRASYEQFQLPPRDRVVPEGDLPGEPTQLSIEDAERLNNKFAKKAAGYASGPRSGRNQSSKRNQLTSSPYTKGQENRSYANPAKSSPYAAETEDLKLSGAAKPTADKPTLGKQAVGKQADKKPAPEKAADTGSVDPWAKWR